MHISAIDVPSDKYGAVSDVARPLVHKLNQSTMSEATFVSLEVLLVWALNQLRDNVRKDLEQHLGRELVVPEHETTETPADETFEPVLRHGIENVSKPVTDPAIALAALLDAQDIKDQAFLAENAENTAALLAEADALVASVETTVVEGLEVKVLTLDMLEDDEPEDSVPAPAPKAVVANPAAKTKAK